MHKCVYWAETDEPHAVLFANVHMLMEEHEASVIARLARAMILFARDAGLRANLSANAISRVWQTTWDAAADMLYPSFVIEHSADRVSAAP